MKLFAPVLLLALAAAVPRGGRVNDAAVTGTAMPATLQAFGFFGDSAATRPSRGVTPYRLQTPLWSDGSDKHRFVYVPPGQRARAQGEGLLDLPIGSALIKTFSFGNRRIETRVLLHRAEGWVALPYRWNEAGDEARLALAGGRVDVMTPAGEAISYAIPNRNQCKECHQAGDAVMPIGPKARNLAPEWLENFRRTGHLDRVPAVARRVPRWEDRAAGPIAAFARGYLDANCAHCHYPAGSASNSGLDLRWEQSDPLRLGIGKRPVAAGRGSGGLEFDIVPGQPDRSILIHRMESLEGGVAMPELGRASLDPEGLAVVRSWIAQMNR
jgi:uncharacterized repeat protein (TIGR03806 family)